MAAGASVLPPEGPSVEGALLFPAEAAGLASLLLTPRPSAAFRARPSGFRVFVLCVFPCVCWLWDLSSQPGTEPGLAVVGTQPSPLDHRGSPSSSG